MSAALDPDVIESMKRLGLDGGDSLDPKTAASAKRLGLETDEPATLMGVGKAMMAAVPKVAMNTAGTPGALDDLSKEASAWLASKISGKPAAEIQQAMSGVPGPMALLLGNGAISPQTIQSNIEKTTGPLDLYEPRNRAEKFADTATQFVLGMGKPSVNNLAMGLSGAAGTEAAGAVTGDNHAARFAGGLLGSGVPAMVNAWQGAPARAVRQAVGNTSEAQIAQALARQAGGQQVGVPLMGAESMPNSGLQQLAADVNASRSGAPVMRQFLEGRPDQVRTAVKGGLLGNLGPSMSPEAAAALAQQTATNVVSAAEKARTAAVNPMYEAARSDVIGPDALEGISQALRNQRPFFELPAQQSALAGYQRIVDPKQGMNAIAMDNLYKAARGDVNVPSIGATSADKQAAAVLRPIEADLRAASELSPNIKAGRELYQQITNDTINPLISGPVGRIAGMKSGGFDPATTAPVARVTAELSNANQVRPDTIRATYTALNAQDPQAFPAMARTYLENAFDQATQRIQGGDNRMMGSSFNKAIRGTDQERANFDEILRGVAEAHGVPPDRLVSGAKVLMDTLESTGKIPGVGSPTAGRADLAKELGKTVTGNALSAVSSRPVGWIQDRYSDAMIAGRYQSLAKVLTAPDSVQQIVKMAKLKPDGTTARWYASQLFNATREVQ